MSITPAEIRTLRMHANFVQERLNNAERLDFTPQSKEQYEWAKGEFEKRYPHYKWQDWAEKPKTASTAR